MPHEFTDSASAGMKAEVSGQVEAGVPVAGKARIGSKYESSRSANSQVVSKATIQTLFGNLHASENALLAIGELKERVLPRDLDSIRRIVSDGAGEADPKWMVPVSELRRGELVEIEVELEADPIFQIGTILSNLKELADESEDLRKQVSGSVFEQLEGLNRVLDKLMVGLIPIRCRVVDWVLVRSAQRDMLVRRVLSDALASQGPLEVEEVYLVADTEQELYWKDVRRVLFSSSRFRVFCRLNGDGFNPAWNPVRLTNALEKVHPMLGRQMQGLSLDFSHAVSAVQTERSAREDNRFSALLTYAELLARENGYAMTVEDRRELTALASQRKDEVGSVGDSREAFASIKNWLGTKIDVSANSRFDSDARYRAMEMNGLVPGGEGKGAQFMVEAIDPEMGQKENLLDASVIGMYW